MRKQFENKSTQSEKTLSQEAHDQSKPVELTEQQLDMVAGGGTKTAKETVTFPTETVCLDYGKIQWVYTQQPLP
jgi:hypothetical protein